MRRCCVKAVEAERKACRMLAANARDLSAFKADLDDRPKLQIDPSPETMKRELLDLQQALHSVLIELKSWGGAALNAHSPERRAYTRLLKASQRSRFAMRLASNATSSDSLDDEQLPVAVPDLIDVEECAEMLNRSPNAVRQLVKKGKLARAPQPDGRVMFSRSYIKEFSEHLHKKK